jgi:sugar/nucleoside kinase (ribokinase family)
MLAREFAQVVVKHGALGAIAAEHGAAVDVPTAPVIPVDSTGAGDAFAAGLLAACADGASLSRAVEVANATGARAVGHLGARPASTG